MTRRRFVPAATAAASTSLASQSATGAGSTAILELRWIRLRNGADNQRQRVTEFMRDAVKPALERAGVPGMAFFATSLGPDTPAILQVTQYASLGAMDETLAKLAADKDYVKATAAFNKLPGLNYQRMESTLLRTVPMLAGISAPPHDGKRPGMLFELRTYESNNSETLKRKIGMFEEGGELEIFRKVGMKTIFFGRTIVGPNQPNLTYMLAYDNFSAREKCWGDFLKHPDWIKLRETPGLADAEIVSNISASFYSPLAFSPVR